MSVSTLIAAGTMPTDVSDLWTLSAMFNAHWGENVVVNTSYQTSIGTSGSASEQRWGLMQIPRHTVKATLQAFGRSQINALMSAMRRMGQCRSLFPLYSDKSHFTTSESSGSTVLDINTVGYRFAASRRVAIVRRAANPQAPSFEIKTILSKTDSTITIDTGTAGAYTPADFVVPLIEANVLLMAQGTVVTDRVATISVTAVESSGPTQLPGLVLPGTLPVGFDTYDDLPILVADENYADEITFGMTRPGSIGTSGIASVPTVYGDRSAEQFQIPVLTENRAEADALLRFFDSRGGRLFPFYYVSPLTEFTPVSVVGASSGIVVVAEGESVDWNFRPYIGIVLKDGTTIVRYVSEVLRVSGNDTITFDVTAEAFTLDDIERVTTARLCRFDQDGITENWVTTKTMRTSLDIFELTNEAQITVENLTPLESTSLTVNTAVTCGSTAAPTYYQAQLCDGTPAMISLENFGQTLPYEFKIVGDEEETCYRIPLGAPTISEPVGTVPEEIIQGVCCDGGGEPELPEATCYTCGSIQTSQYSTVSGNWDFTGVAAWYNNGDLMGDPYDYPSLNPYMTGSYTSSRYMGSMFPDWWQPYLGGEPCAIFLPTKAQATFVERTYIEGTDSYVDAYLGVMVGLYADGTMGFAVMRLLDNHYDETDHPDEFEDYPPVTGNSNWTHGEFFWGVSSADTGPTTWGGDFAIGHPINSPDVGYPGDSDWSFSGTLALNSICV